MSKRKRDATEVSNDDTNTAQNVQILKFKVFKRLAQGKRALSRVLKQCKRPENQRIHKRIVRAKEAGESERVNRLERELEALKALDTSVLAEHHIRKTISRTKDVSASPVLSRYLSAAAACPDSDGQTKDAMLVARNNVTARLYNAKTVKKEVAVLLRNVRRALEISGGEDDREASNEAMLERRGRGNDPEQSQNGDISASEGSFWAGSDAEPQHGGQSKTKAPKTKTGCQTSQFRSSIRKGVSAAVQSDLENDDSQHLSRKAQSTPTASSDSESDFAVPSTQATAGKGKASDTKEARTTNDNKKTSANSTFLPTLMAGGYWSGSESAEDIEQLQPRKNRRGQRARQAIWELKYGRNANHLKKAALHGGWDPRRGARDRDGVGSQQRRTDRRQAPPSKAQPQRVDSGTATTAQDQLRSTGKTDKEQPLHPSWEAARQAKAQKQSASFQGKKIVFD